MFESTGVQSNLPVPWYPVHIVSELKELAQQWRCNSDDQDGCALATIHAVGKLLPGYVDSA